MVIINHGLKLLVVSKLIIWVVLRSLLVGVPGKCRWLNYFMAITMYSVRYILRCIRFKVRKTRKASHDERLCIFGSVTYTGE